MSEDRTHKCLGTAARPQMLLLFATPGTPGEATAVLFRRCSGRDEHGPALRHTMPHVDTSHPRQRRPMSAADCQRGRRQRCGVRFAKPGAHNAEDAGSLHGETGTSGSGQGKMDDSLASLLQSQAAVAMWA